MIIIIFPQGAYHLMGLYAPQDNKKLNNNSLLLVATIDNKSHE